MSDKTKKTNKVQNIDATDSAALALARAYGPDIFISPNDMQSYMAIRAVENNTAIPVGNGVRLGYYHGNNYAFQISFNLKKFLMDHAIRVTDITEFYLQMTATRYSGNELTYTLKSNNYTTVDTDENGGGALLLPLLKYLRRSPDTVYFRFTSDTETDLLYSPSNILLFCLIKNVRHELICIKIIAPPNKTIYNSGETFDKTGMIVQAEFDDFTEKISDYTYYPSGALNRNNRLIELSYTYDNRTEITWLPITVNSPLSKIDITHNPTKTTYNIGEAFDKSGMKVIATYEDGTTSIISNYDVSQTVFDNIGNFTITVGYTENGITKTTTLNVNVRENITDKYFGNAEYGDNPYINLATQRLTYVQKGLTVGGGAKMIGINLVYDSQMKKRVADKCAGMPEGWKFDAHRFVFRDGHDEAGNDIYKYIDGSGYVHAFYLAAGDRYFEKQSNLEMVVTNTEITISDPDELVKLTFENERLSKSEKKCPGGALVTLRYTYDTAGQLRYIRNDEAGISVTITYGASEINILTMFNNSSEKMRIVISNNRLKNIVYNDVHDVASFSYDTQSHKKLTLITDAENGDAVRITYVRNSNFGEYCVDKIEKGYIDENDFTAKQTMSVLRTGVPLGGDISFNSEIKIETELGAECIMLDRDGVPVSEFRATSTGYETVTRETGITLPYDGTSSTTINGKKAGTLPVTISVSSGDNINKFKDEKYFDLGFMLFINEAAARAVVDVIIHFQNNYTFTKRIDVNAEALKAWQKVTVPIIGNGTAISHVSIDCRKANGNLISSQIAYITLIPKKTDNSLKISYGLSAADFSDIMGMTVITPDGLTDNYNIYGSDTTFLTASDFVENFKRIKRSGGATEIVCNNGKCRIQNVEDILFTTNENVSIPVKSGALYTETIDKDGTSLTEEYYVFTSTGSGVSTKTTTAKCDESGNVTGNTSSTVLAEYDLFGNLLKMTDAYGIVTEYTYHKSGEVKKQTVGGITVYESFEDADGNIYEEREGGRATGYAYTSPTGLLDRSRRMKYNGNEEWSTARSYLQYYYSDNFSRRLTSTILRENVNGVMQSKDRNDMTYTNGRLSRVANGNTAYGFGYDKATDAVTVKSGNTVLYKQSVSSDGKLVTKQYNKSQTSRTSSVECYNDYGELEYVSPNSSATGAYMRVHYKSAGSDVIPASSPIDYIEDSCTNRTIRYSYDVYGEPDGMTYYNGETEEFAVNKTSDGKTAISFGTNESYTVSASYDPEKPSAPRLTATIVGNGTTSPTPVLSSMYTYDAMGRLSERGYTYFGSSSYQGTSASEARDHLTTYVYAADGKTVTATKFKGYYGSKATGIVSTDNSREATVNVAYTYDDYGNISSVTETTEAKSVSKGKETVVIPETTHTVSYEYDAANRLVKEISDGASAEYKYDNNGRMTVRNGSALNYDARGRLTMCGYKSYAYDDYGNRTSDGTRTYTWTRGRLLSSMGGVNFVYDGNGLRYSKTSGGVKTVYFRNGDTLLGEDRDSRKLRYFYDRSGINAFTCDGEVYGYVKNLFGDIIAITKDYSVVARYRYDAWGNHKVLNPDGSENMSADFIGNINPIRYRGYYFDKETGLYYLQTRYYDPEVGQFISPDTFDYLDPSSIGGVNLYAYCNYNPVMYVDGFGCDPLPWWGKLLIGIGFVIVGAAITALIAGTGTGFMAAFGSALLTSTKALAISTAISAGIGLTMGGLTTGTLEGALNGMIAGTVDGFMWGGIFAGGAQILSAGFKGVATIANKFGKLNALKKSPIFSPDRLKNAREIAKILEKGQSFYDYGGTLFRFGRFAHIDVSSKSLLHLAIFGFKHIPIGTIGAGIIGGL